ncbi:MAG: TolC family protein [Planctomycetota bacterium]|nr:TolC family protein [Planctomycetota bacterium]
MGTAFSGPAWAIVVGLLASTLGCRASQTIRDAEFTAIAIATPVASPCPQSIASATMPVEPSLAGPLPVEEYVAFALAQNPEIQVKRKQFEAAAMRVPQAASLDDPLLDVTGYPFYPYVPQQVGGRVTYEIMASQRVPWFGKLRTKASAAEAEVESARAELVVAELEVLEQVKRVYYELYVVQASLEITEQSRKLAVDFTIIAETKYRTGTVDQQDLLRAQLEVSNTDKELNRMRQELQSGQARLTRLLHVSPDTPVGTLPSLPAEQIPDDVQRLYALAIESRPDLHAQLAAIRRDRLNVDLARLQYYPDLTFKAGWGDMGTYHAMSPIADGIGMLGVGMGANIPIYRKRLEAGVREAEAKTLASAREYDAMRDKAQEEVKDLFAQLTSQEQLLTLFRTDILPKAELTLKASTSAYRTGKIDLLMLIDNWKQLLQYRIGQQRLEAQVRQTLASLERAVGGVSLTCIPGLDHNVAKY